MKYQGVHLLSVRIYLGFFDGADTWNYQKHIVGIKEEEDKIRDFKTGEVYNFVSRKKDGQINLMREKAIEGETYAVEILDDTFEKNRIYTDKEINKIINNSNLFFDEYKNYVPSKQKKKIR